MKSIIFSTCFLFSFSTWATPSKITVSGVSAGAFMAQQFLTAFSSQVSGAGIVAGGPYFCAQGNMLNALNKCMKTSMGVPGKDELLKAAKVFEKEGKIDALANLKSSKVYILSGKLDEVISQKVSDVNVEMYKAWGIPAANLVYINELEVGHAFPTIKFGNPCKTPAESPFISNCNKDVAGEILTHLLGRLVPKTKSLPSQFFSFSQSLSLDKVDVEKYSMDKTGYAYIPQGCEGLRNEKCRIHVAFHGCQQTVEDIKLDFVKNTGYNEWAQSNKIIVLYPQVKKNFLINNPNGCWDWWGYSGPHYHTKNGPQMNQVARLIEALRDGNLKLTAL
jgi:poly(3-hydroxybutyrate) depolymerase